MGSAIAKKLVAAMKTIDAVTKRGQNEKQNYKYVKAADVAQEVRKALGDAGIAFTYSVKAQERWTTDRIDAKTGSIFGAMNYVSLNVEFGFHDTETDDHIELMGLGWGFDVGDKAPYKAMTGALKYALRMNFLIPDELDPENEKAEKKPVFDIDPSIPGPPIVPKAASVIAAVPNVTTANKLTPQQRVEAIKSELNDGQFVADGQKLLCTLKSALSKNGSKGPFVAVKWNGRYEGADGANCFHKSLKDALLLGVGKEVWLKLSMNGSYVNIEDVLSVDGVEYSEGHPVDFDEQLKAATHLAIHSDIPF